MSHGVRWWGTSIRKSDDAGFILRRARGDAAEPDDHPLGQATREQRIRSLVRCELRTGSFEAARLHLLPSRIVEAVDGQPQVPPSGLRVRRIGECARGLKVPYPASVRARLRAELIEARTFREMRHDEMSDDERIVADEVREEMAGKWGRVFNQD